MRIEVVLERQHRLGEPPQQLRLRARLRRVRVEPTGRDIEHRRAEIRADQLRAGEERAAEWRCRVVGQRDVARNVVAQLDRRLVGVEAGPREHREAATGCGLLRVDLHPVGRATCRASLREPLVALQHVRRHRLQRGHESVIRSERERRYRTDVRRSPARVVVAGRRIEQPPEPAGRRLGDVRSRRRGVPDVHRAEVRAIWIRVADALDDRERAALVEFAEPGEIRVQRDPVVERDHRLRVHRQLAARVEVGTVGVRDHGVQTVVATAELDHDQHPAPRERLSIRQLLGEDAAHECGRHQRPGGDERQPACEERATVDATERTASEILCLAHCRVPPCAPRTIPALIHQLTW